MSKNKDNEKFNNPFSALKGLSVSSTQQPEKKPPESVEKPKSVVSEPEPKPEEDADFFTEMAGLGVRKIEQGGREKQAPSKNSDVDTSLSADKAELSAGGTGGSAKSRRGKQLRRGDVEPQVELDLHGVRAEDVDKKVGWFLENAAFHGFEVVRIITGKGVHSNEGPVLRPIVESYFDGPGRRFVVEWMRAPQRQGGEGAIVAFLKR
ncbi:MAG: hypothetical protein C0615_07830 [Desulfuromonas sp.]|nr:MAG: hypothetical protein C0615_07830 [Desulfuromonas sp.]